MYPGAVLALDRIALAIVVARHQDGLRGSAAQHRALARVARPATELLQRYPNAIVVMCTSLTTRDKVIACQKAGVSHYLLKPFQPERAIAVMRHLLTRTGAVAPAQSVAS